MAAFNASRLVWSAISLMTFKMVSILPVACSSSRTTFTAWSICSESSLMADVVCETILAPSITALSASWAEAAAPCALPATSEEVDAISFIAVASCSNSCS